MNLLNTLLLWLLLCGITTAQSLPLNAAGQPEFQQVVRLDSSRTARQLITQCRAWVAARYNSATDVVQQYDPATGVLIVRGVAKLTTPVVFHALGKDDVVQAPLNLNYLLTVEARPGRYRVTLGQLRQEGNGIHAPIPAQPYTPEVAYEQVKTILQSEKKRQQAVDDTIRNQQSLISVVRSHCESLLADLEQHLHTVSTEKDW